MTDRVADRYLIRLAVRKVVSSPSFRTRAASVSGLTPQVLEAFVEAFAIRRDGRVAFFGNIKKKLEQLVAIFQKAPQVWDSFKKMLNVDSLLKLPKILKDWARKGYEALKKVFRYITYTLPIALFTILPNKMPTITDMMNRIMGKNEKIAHFLSGVRDTAVRVDEWLNKYLPTLKRPLLAAVYIWCWWNVAELSFDLRDAFIGFLGGISLGQLFAELPEWGLSFIAGVFGLAWGAVPFILIARILWLISHKYLEWVPGKGVKVRWDLIEGNRESRPELVPVM